MAKVKKSRWIHTFSVNKESEVEEKEVRKDEDGKDITVLKKVTKEIPVKFMLKRPTRKLLDKADLFYSVKLSQGIKAGLLTRTLLARRYDDDGGLWSEDDQDNYFKVYDKLVLKENEYQKNTLNLDEKRSKEKEQEGERLLREITDLRKSLAQYEEVQQSIFNNTAENRARNATIMWWVLNLSYKQGEEQKDGGKKGYELVFGGETYEEKLDSYDEMEEEYDNFADEVIKKLAFFVSFWYTGRISDSEDFKVAEDIYRTNNGDFEDEDVDVETERNLREIHDEKIKIESVEKRDEMEKEKIVQETKMAVEQTQVQLDEAKQKDKQKSSPKSPKKSPQPKKEVKDNKKEKK